jgi:hypothetical protein
VRRAASEALAGVQEENKRPSAIPVDQGGLPQGPRAVEPMRELATDERAEVGVVIGVGRLASRTYHSRSKSRVIGPRPG